MHRNLSSPHVVECYGATRTQVGHTANEDAFVIEHDPVPYAAVFDGAGNAERAATRVARFFKTLIKGQTARVGNPGAWEGWVRLMDSHLIGGAQCTFIGVAVPDVEASRLIGAYAGNSRAYLVGEAGAKLITVENSPGRLGGGNAHGKTFSLQLGPHDILLLMSDGAWGPFGSMYLLSKTTMSALSKHFSDVPLAILAAATPPDGPPDDMTVIALRLRYRVGV